MDYYNYPNFSSFSFSSDRCPATLRSNRTLITDIYSGIPDNLLLNVIGFTVLVILFGLLRKKAWDYGRLALLHKTDNRWMEIFYGNNDDRESSGAVCVEVPLHSQLSQVDRGFLSWITTAFKITDAELFKRAGPDGLLYISFERYLIILTGLMVVVSLCIALPINLSGSMQPESAKFAHTTLSNLDPASSWIWVHTIILLSYLPIGAYIMRKFLKKVREVRPGGELAARTLLISEIPKHQCNVDTLMEYFKEAFATLTVEDITLAYDIQRLSVLDAERDCAQQARLYCENYAKNKEPLKMHPYPCGQALGCCCRSVDALEVYTNEEIRLTALVEEEKKVTLSKPIGVAFVTLGTPGAAKSLRRQLRSSPTIKWIVDYAPAPSDIFWENLSIPRPCWYLNAIMINVALGIAVFFLTTPATILTAVTRLPITGEIMNLNPVLSTFLPTLVLVSAAALMPVLVAKSESLVRHWTRSSLNRTVMKKTLMFLLLMVLILPSLGLTSAMAFFSWTLDPADNSTGGWQCVFLPDQGALFVNYIITAALLGSALELVRFPELLLYTFRLCIARSKAESMYVRKAVLWEFPLGAHYAWLLLVFTMTTVYSVACPLITPFGLLYLLVKHLVDRHNLCFAYGPSVGGGQLVGAAVGAAGVAPVLAQFALMTLGLVRRGLSPLAAVQLSGLAASILGLVTGAALPVTKPKTQIYKRDLSTGQNFVPPVLRRQQTPMEETISTNSTSDANVSSPKSTTSSSIPENTALYQNYGKGERV